MVSRSTRTGLSLRLLVPSGSPRALSPRDDKVGGRKALAMTRLLTPSLGSFGLAPPQTKTPLASSLLAFLETNTEAHVNVAAARGAVAALS